MNRRNFTQRIGLGLLLTCTLLVAAILGGILFDITSQGLPALSWAFLSQPPRNGMTEGGILTPIIGTFWVTMTTTLFALPVGVACAVYLTEYATDTALNRMVRASIRNLSGVPSIIYGLFGVAVFVEGLRFGTSILSAGLTLGLLTLPYIITTTQEALRTVPKSVREGSLALGATRWETIHRVVLPGALPGILTGVILSLSRAAGETAPILFTGVTFYERYPPNSPFDAFMALPYHLYVLSTQHHAIEQVRPLAYATALVLIGLVFLLNIVAFILRYRYRVAE